MTFCLRFAIDCVCLARRYFACFTRSHFFQLRQFFHFFEEAMMKKAMKCVLLVSSLVALALMQSCATKIKASTAENPPPKEAFSAYGRVEVKQAIFRPGYSASPASLAKIEANLKKDLAISLATWNQRPANGRTLIIEPVVDEIQFNRVVKRVFLGPLAGSSGVLMHLKISDARGDVVAMPEFFQRADAWGAGFTLGVHDNLMLTRVANLASQYIIANYRSARGGPTGADDKAISVK
jgi:hypothetical protein